MALIFISSTHFSSPNALLICLVLTICGLVQFARICFSLLQIDFYLTLIYYHAFNLSLTNEVVGPFSADNKKRGSFISQALFQDLKMKKEMAEGCCKRISHSRVLLQRCPGHRNLPDKQASHTDGSCHYLLSWGLYRLIHTFYLNINVKSKCYIHLW